VNRLRIGYLGRRDDRGNVEVAQRRRRRADTDRLVGERHIFCVAVGFRVNDDGLDAHLATGALDAQRDLAAVCDQDLVEQLVGLSGQPTSRDDKQRLAEFDGLAIFGDDGFDRAARVRFDFVHQLHRLDDAKNIALLHRVADFHEWLRAR